MKTLFSAFYCSIRTASDRPECGVFIAELLPNSVAHNAGLKVRDIVEHVLIERQSFRVAELLQCMSVEKQVVAVTRSWKVKQGLV